MEPAQAEILTPTFPPIVELVKLFDEQPYNATPIEREALQAMARERIEATKDDLAECEQLNMEDLVHRLQNVYEELERVHPLKLAVIGNSGAGKSTLINSLRDLRPTDPGAAMTRTVECTTSPTPYPFPDHPQIELWDLPGIGTQRFPRATYAEDLDLVSYDLFLIVTAGRFTENDALLVKVLEDVGKPFAVIRNKLDQSIEENSDLGIGKEETMRMLREEIRSGLARCSSKMECPVFLISSRYQYRGRYEFAQMQTFMLANVAPLKRQSLLVGMRSASADIIRQKANICRASVATYARIASATAFVNPVPFADVAVNFAVIAHATLWFVRVLGLNSPMFKTPGYSAAVLEAGEVALKTDAARVFGAVGVIAVTISSAAVAELVAELISPGYWAKAGLQYSALLTVEAVADFLPLIGWAVGGISAYYFTKWGLHNTIDKLEAKALQLLEDALDERQHK